MISTFSQTTSDDFTFFFFKTTNIGQKMALSTSHQHGVVFGFFFLMLHPSKSSLPTLHCTFMNGFLSAVRCSKMRTPAILNHPGESLQFQFHLLLLLTKPFSSIIASLPVDLNPDPDPDPNPPDLPSQLFSTRTTSSLLAKTTEFSPLSQVPTSSTVNSANSWNPMKVFRYETAG